MRWSRVERASRLLVLGIIAAITVLHVAYMLSAPHGTDIAAYWNAAERLREGLPLYPEFADIDAHDVYRYSPWFAYLWVPITYLPLDFVAIVWTVLLLAASAVCVHRLWGRGIAGFALLLLFGGELVIVSFYGNVHPLMLAPLVWGVDRRSGPLWIALAASLKAAPLAFILVYVGRREWDKVAATLSITAVLVLPMLAFDLTHYTTSAGFTWGLAQVSMEAWAMVAILAALPAVAWARSRRGWLWGSIAAIAAFPRLLGYDMTLLLVGLQPRIGERQSPVARPAGKVTIGPRPRPM